MTEKGKWVMAKYHIGKNGPAVCRANKRACRYETTSGHFESLEDARVAAENMEKKASGGETVSAPLRKGVNKNSTFSIKASACGEGFIQIWKNDDGEYHREDGPAIIDSKNTEYWYLNDKLHRENGPAVVSPNGDQEWWLNDVRHRENGPAVVFKDGSQQWWLNGGYHNKNGPAVINSIGGREWWVNGKRHREDGPAIIDADGYEEWWIKGVNIHDSNPWR